MKTIAERLKESSRSSIYKKAAEIFAVDYSLVVKIGSEKRKAVRGKSKEIKQWLEKQISE